MEETGTMDGARLHRLAEGVLSAWNSQDVERVLACYTDDLVYLDPNTRGPVVGRAAMRSYLTKLFRRWKMTWAGDEMFPLYGNDGTVIRWAATLAPWGGDRSVEVCGLDLVLLEGDLIQRNEVYYDLSPLAVPLPPASA
jgi:SnoaL-like domain